jgi:hypothetical protein
VKLHELEDLEDVLKFKEPCLRVKCKQDLDPVAFPSLLDCSVANLENSLLALDADFRDKALVILENVDDQLLGLASPIRSPLANLELKAGVTVSSHVMLDVRGSTQVGRLDLSFLVLPDQIGLSTSGLALRPRKPDSVA